MASAGVVDSLRSAFQFMTNSRNLGRWGRTGGEEAPASGIHDNNCLASHVACVVSIVLCGTESSPIPRNHAIVPSAKQRCRSSARGRCQPWDSPESRTLRPVPSALLRRCYTYTHMHQVQRGSVRFPSSGGWVQTEVPGPQGGHLERAAEFGVPVVSPEHGMCLRPAWGGRGTPTQAHTQLQAHIHMPARLRWGAHCVQTEAAAVSKLRPWCCSPAAPGDGCARA